MSVPSYFMKLKSLWDEIESIAPRPRCSHDNCVCNVQLPCVSWRSFCNCQDPRLWARYQHFRWVTYHLVAEDEQQKLISSLHKPNNESMEFQTSSSRYNNNRKDLPKCDHYRKEGHWKGSYWDIIGYPPNWGKQNREKKEQTNNWGAKKGTSKVAQVSNEMCPILGLSQ